MSCAVLVEREDGHVDLGHDLREQSARLEGSEALLAERGREGVDLQEHFAERVVGSGPARADREVVLAHRGEQIRDGLERPDDPLPQRLREGQKPSDEEGGQRPAELGREVAGPEENERRRHRGQRGRCGEEEYPAIVGQPLHGNEKPVLDLNGPYCPCFSSRR